MSRPVGRHRVRRETGLRALRRPAVAATAAISAVSVSAAGYATATSAVASSSAGATMQTGARASGAALGAANAAVVADASAQLTAKNAAVAARAAAAGKSKSQLAKQRAHSAALQTKAEKAASAKRSSVAKAKAAAAKAKAEAAAKAKAAAAAKAKAEAAAKRNRDTQSVSRSSERPPATQTPTYGGSPQAIASSMLGSYGWGQDQMGCLTALWNKESGWNVYASNPSSGAYGIPQSLPGSKMASAGGDWRTNPATQIRWGLGYIRSSYGSPCGAWGHSQATGWY